MNERDALLRAILTDPADDTPRLVLADWLDERGEYVAAARQRVIARPADDGLRLAYADAADDAGEDYALHGAVVRAMVRHPDWFEDRPFTPQSGHAGQLWTPERYEAVELVQQNLDLIAWADLDLPTHAAPGNYVWHRETGVTNDHDNVLVTFSRGFASSVRTTLATFRRTAPGLFRHPVESVRLWDLEPWGDVHGTWFGWWDENRVITGDEYLGNNTLPTLMMMCMDDDPRRVDHNNSIRFQPDRGGMGGCCLFESAADALAALARAAWKYGRLAADAADITAPSASSA